MNPGQPNFEAIPAKPETQAETSVPGAGFEAPKTVERPSEQASPVSQVTGHRSPTSPPAAAKDETTKAVENALEEGLRDVYAKLPAGRKAKFQKEGERITREISAMVKSLKVQADRVLGLIRKWLALIPGVNKFFLIQEAKLKTDRIMLIAEEEKAKRTTTL